MLSIEPFYTILTQIGKKPLSEGFTEQSLEAAAGNV